MVSTGEPLQKMLTLRITALFVLFLIERAVKVKVIGI